VVGSLEAGRGQIEEAILARALAVSPVDETSAAEYLAGLRGAAGAALDHGLAAVRWGAERTGPPPAAVLSQARLAARNRVGLEIVLRRYAAGYTVLGDFLLQVTLGRGIETAEVYSLQRELTSLFDTLVSAVSSEYRKEVEALAKSSSRRFADLVTRLLGGELINTGMLGYELEGWHVGIVFSGLAAAAQLRKRTSRLGRLLYVEVDGNSAWGWLGSDERLCPEMLESALRDIGSELVTVGIGEPAEATAGWRLSHRQAAAAHRIAQQRQQACVRYRDVALLVALSRDGDLVAFLRDTYLEPLASGRDEGAALRATLRAYFRCGRNLSSAAAALGIARQTVASRLAVVEERLGRSVDCVSTDLEALLGLEELGVLATESAY
jgi:hypothetical protein